MVDAGPLTDNLLGSTHCRFSCAASSLSPRNQKAKRDLHVSLFRLSSPFSVPLEMRGRIIEAAASESTKFAFV